MTSRYIFEHNEVDLDLTITSNNIQIFMMIYDIFIHFITHLKFHSVISPSIQFFCSLLEFISCLRSFVAILFCYEILKRYILVMKLQIDSNEGVTWIYLGNVICTFRVFKYILSSHWCVLLVNKIVYFTPKRSERKWFYRHKRMYLICAQCVYGIFSSCNTWKISLFRTFCQTLDHNFSQVPNKVRLVICRYLTLCWVRC